MKKLSDTLTKLSEAMESGIKQYETNNDEWWNSLSEDERMDAFYAVVKRIHKAELIDKGTYRWALYEVFGFDESMYTLGIDCGFMDLHNAISCDND